MLQDYISQEILGAATGGRRNGPLFVGNRRKDGEFRIHVLGQIHNGRHVAAAVAIIGRRPDGHNVLGLEVIFEAFIDQLMGASDEGQAVDMVKLGDHTPLA